MQTIGKEKQHKPHIVDIRKVIAPQGATLQKQSSIASHNRANPESLVGGSHGIRNSNIQGVIAHTCSNEMLYPLTDNYPLAIANVVNKPLICY